MPWAPGSRFGTTACCSDRCGAAGAVRLRSGAFIGFLTLVAFFGPTGLPIPTELGFAIGLLVLGVGFASLGLGIGIARAHRDEATDTDGGAAFSQSTRNP